MTRKWRHGAPRIQRGSSRSRCSDVPRRKNRHRPKSLERESKFAGSALCHPCIGSTACLGGGLEEAKVLGQRGGVTALIPTLFCHELFEQALHRLEGVVDH